MDICLSMKQFCCATTEEHTLNYFKRKKKKKKRRFLVKSRKLKYWKALLNYHFALSALPRTYATKQNISSDLRLESVHLYIATLILKYFLPTNRLQEGKKKKNHNPKTHSPKSNTTFAKGTDKACITWCEKVMLAGARTCHFEQAKKANIMNNTDCASQPLLLKMEYILCKLINILKLLKCCIC